MPVRTAAETARMIKELAAECGYVACGITSAEPFERDREAVEHHIRQYPEAAPLYTYFRRRVDPKATAPWCRSVIACIRWYGKYRLPDALIDHIGRNYLGDCRVKACPDYSMAREMTNGLRAMGITTKRGGVPDRWAAVRAGVARFGRNSFVYAGEYGSWINVQTWRVDVELPIDEPNLDLACPVDCRACMEACPTGAIEAPLCMRMDRCIAYLTYSAPWPIDPGLWTRMGAWVYGCDVCQTACPLNRGAWRNLEEAPWIADLADRLTPDALASMDPDTYERLVHPLFWYIPKDDLARWHANARRATAAAKCSGELVGSQEQSRDAQL